MTRKKSADAMVDSGTSFYKKEWFLALALLAAVVLAYAPAWNGQPIWDDDAHMTKPDLRPVSGLARIWFQPGATQQYYPVVHSVFWVEHALWGDAVTGYHFVNILLHFLAALLLITLLRKLRIPGAWLAGWIFALHPVEVESVAWISELKNTLSAVFCFATALAYLKFDEKRTLKGYAAALLLFIPGLLSKTVIAPLPLVLLILFWWQRGRLKIARDLLPLVPLFLVALVAGVFTSLVESHFIIGRAGEEFQLSFVERCLLAGRVFWFYLGKLCLPVNLTFIYPRWQVSQAIWWQYLFPAAALALGMTLWTLRKRSRAPLAAYLCFPAMLFPAMGFFNVYPFRYSYVADHFQYFAGIVPIVFAAAGLTVLFGKRGGAGARRAVPLLAIGIPLLLGTLTWLQCGMYRDVETLYKTTIARNPGCWMAYCNLAVIRTNQGKNDEAEAFFKKALEVDPRCAEALTGLGNLAMKNGRQDQSFAYYNEAINSSPGYITAYHDMGDAAEKAGKSDEAIALFRKALAIDSTSGTMHYRLGSALMASGQNDEALKQFSDAVRYSPYDGQAYDALGVLLFQAGRSDEAVACFTRALAIDSTDELAYCNFGNAMMKLDHPDLAAGYFRKATQLNPADEVAANGLQRALAGAGAAR